jgi:hypothetical protein
VPHSSWLHRDECGVEFSPRIVVAQFNLQSNFVVSAAPALLPSAERKRFARVDYLGLRPRLVWVAPVALSVAGSIFRVWMALG